MASRISATSGRKFIGVTVNPGETLLTRTPRSAHSVASDRLRCATAAFELL